MKKLAVLLWEGEKAEKEDWGSRFLQGRRGVGGVHMWRRRLVICEKQANNFKWLLNFKHCEKVSLNKWGSLSPLHPLCPVFTISLYLSYVFHVLFKLLISTLELRLRNPEQSQCRDQAPKVQGDLVQPEENGPLAKSPWICWNSCRARKCLHSEYEEGPTCSDELCLFSPSPVAEGTQPCTSRLGMLLYCFGLCSRLLSPKLSSFVSGQY